MRDFLLSFSGKWSVKLLCLLVFGVELLALHDPHAALLAVRIAENIFLQVCIFSYLLRFVRWWNKHA
jgi:hypothetical protein